MAGGSSCPLQFHSHRDPRLLEIFNVCRLRIKIYRSILVEKKGVETVLLFCTSGSGMLRWKSDCSYNRDHDYDHDYDSDSYYLSALSQSQSKSFLGSAGLRKCRCKHQVADEAPGSALGVCMRRALHRKIAFLMAIRLSASTGPIDINNHKISKRKGASTRRQRGFSLRTSWIQ